MQSLSEIIFEDINSEYGYGMYLGLKIIICKSTGFVNATKLCAKFGKQLKHWLENKASKDLIEELALAGIPTTATVNGGLQELQSKITGTYVHKLLIPHIASWISPSVGIKVSQIVNEFVISEKLREKEQMLREKDDKIQILMNKVDDQSKRINTLLTKTDNVIQQNEELKSKNDHLIQQNDHLIQQNEEIKDDVDIVSTKLDVATDQRVVPLKSLRDEIFMVFRTGEDQYYACRIQKLRRNYSISKYGNPVLEIENSNTVNLLLHIKDDESLKGKVKCYRNTIRILDDRVDLIAEIRRVDREKKTL